MSNMNKKTKITKEDIDRAFNLSNENGCNDVIYINGIPFKNVHIPLNDYARQIGALPYNETMISKM